MPFPEDTTLLLAGFLISHHVIKILPVLVVVIGALIADMLIFFLLDVNRVDVLLSFHDLGRS